MASSVLIIYFLASLGFITYLFKRSRPLVLFARLLYLCCPAVHLAFIINLGIDLNHLPVSTPFQGINMTVFFASTLLIPFVWRRSTTVLATFYLPAATFTLGVIMPYVENISRPLAESYKYLYPLHTLTVICGEALFVVAFIISLVYLIHERIIRTGAIHSLFSGLPPLTLLDTILYVCLSSGFTCITIGMILGGFWASSLNLDFTSIVPKVSAGAVMWLVFAVGLHQRFALGWRGRRTAIITLIGFFLMIILFIGMNIAFPHAHGTGLIP